MKKLLGVKLFSLIALASLSAIAGTETPTGLSFNQPLSSVFQEKAEFDLKTIYQSAEQLQDPKNDGVALLTRALQAAGFAIWSDDRTVIAPSTVKSNGIAFTTSEVKDMVALFRRGDSVALKDFIASANSLASLVGKPVDLTSQIQEFLSQGSVISEYRNSAGKTVQLDSRGPSLLLSALAAQNQNIDPTPGNFGNTELDAVQAMILMRIVSEEIAIGLRRSIAASNPELYASINPSPVIGQGWAEDAAVSGITGIIDKVRDAYKEVSPTAEVAKGISGKINLISSIVKFITTFKFLKGEMKVEAPGNPLVRTKDTTAGDTRTISATIKIDGTAATDWLKDNRTVISLLGIDVDMPKSGPMAGIETNWEIGQSRKYASQQIVRLAPGSGDISKVKTDANGVASIKLQGAPQPKKLDPNGVTPYMRQVHIKITPQVKGTEMQQDVVDAVTGAIGIKDGPTGILAPIMECLYRLKWKTIASMNLEVKDWQAADVIANFDLEIKGSGHTLTKEYIENSSINRYLKVENMIMAAQNVEMPEGLDPEMLKSLPPTVRKQMEEGLKAMTEMAKTPSYLASGPGLLAMGIHDQTVYKALLIDCEVETQQGTLTLNGDKKSDFSSNNDNALFHFGIEANLENKTASATIIYAIPVKMVLTRTPKTPEGNQDVTQEMHILEKIKRADGKKFTDPIVFPLNTTVRSDGLGTDYYGVLKIPIKFGSRLQYDASMIASFSIKTRAKKK